MGLATKSCRQVISALGAIALAAPLAACATGDLSRTFGFTRDSPDEFTVTTQAPLTIPPDYTIRPPRPGAPRPQDVPDQVAAQEALIPQTALAPGSDAAMSPGQQALIQQAGPPAQANIRTQIAQEQTQLNGGGQSFAGRLMFWRSPQPAGIAVDPQKESQRLREDAALGQSPTVGQTPIIQPKPQGLLQGIF